MDIKTDVIKKLIENGNLKDVSRKTGIPYRTLQDWKYGNNKWLNQAIERLEKIQKYMEESK